MKGELSIGGRDTPFFIRVARTEGKPVEAAGARIIPRALELQIAVRGGQSMFVWARPVSIDVEQDGRRRRLPVRDVTRGVELMLMSSAIGAYARVLRIFDQMTKK